MRMSSPTAFLIPTLLISILSANPALASSDCMAALIARGKQLGLETDSDSRNALVLGSNRNAIASLFAPTQECLGKAYAKKGRGGKSSTVYSNDGGGTCNLPDLDRMGGSGRDRNKYAIWISCK